MKCLTLSALLLLACQADPPARPLKELDPKDPRSVLEHAAYKTRSQKSYETRFKARLTTSGATGSFSCGVEKSSLAIFACPDRSRIRAIEIANPVSVPKLIVA